KGSRGERHPGEVPGKEIGREVQRHLAGPAELQTEHIGEDHDVDGHQEQGMTDSPQGAEERARITVRVFPLHELPHEPPVPGQRRNLFRDRGSQTTTARGQARCARWAHRGGRGARASEHVNDTWLRLLISSQSSSKKVRAPLPGHASSNGDTPSCRTFLFAAWYSS